MIEKDEGYGEQHRIWEIPDTGVQAVHINQDDNPVDCEYRYVTVIFCTDKKHPNGVLVYAGSDMSQGISHQAIYDFARDSDLGVLDHDTAVGQWGVLLNAVRGEIIRESRGFKGEIDDQLLDLFVYSLREELGLE